MKKGIILIATVVLSGLMSTTSSTVLASNTSVMIVAQKGVFYKEIKVGDLPANVSSAVSDNYADYKVLKTYIGDDDTYKITLIKEGESINVFFNANGEFLKISRARDLLVK